MLRFPITLDMHNNLVDQNGVVIAVVPFGGDPDKLLEVFRIAQVSYDADSEVFDLIQVPTWLK